MNLPSLNTANLEGKRVIVRADLDVAIEGEKIVEDKRLQVLIPTLNLILKKGAQKIVVIGHRGRPKDGVEEKLKISLLMPYFKEHLQTPSKCLEYVSPELLGSLSDLVSAVEEKIVFLENLRFYSEEEADDDGFAQSLASIGDFYVNEAFAASHRAHASIVGVPLKIKEKDANGLALGLRFEEELQNLSKVTENPERPLISLISGVKEDKLKYLDSFKKFSDVVLVAGRLPEFMPEDFKDARILVAKLNPDKEDITIHSIEKFEDFVSTARTIILAGPIGRFEDGGHTLGTTRVLNAIANSKAFKIAGGGDTQHAIEALHLTGSFDWLSVGGGAMLEYLANGTLPGIDVFNKG